MTLTAGIDYDETERVIKLIDSEIEKYTRSGEPAARQVVRVLESIRCAVANGYEAPVSGN